jgi:hypothetical protein
MQLTNQLNFSPQLVVIEKIISGNLSILAKFIKLKPLLPNFSHFSQSFSAQLLYVSSLHFI